MEDGIFRKYDIRGHWNKDWDEKDLPALAMGIAVYFKQMAVPAKRVLIGGDARISVNQVKIGMASAFLMVGIEVVDAGVCTTPELQFSMRALQIEAGIMVTASHNPWSDQGLKLFYNYQPVWGQQLQEILAIVKTLQDGSYKVPSDSKLANIYRWDAHQVYLNTLVNQFANLKGHKLNLLFDALNGATATLFPALIVAMGWRRAFTCSDTVDTSRYKQTPEFIEAMSKKHGVEPEDVLFPPDPMSLRAQQRTLNFIKKFKVDFAFMFDGDGDRLAVMDSQGNFYNGEMLLAVFARQLESATLPNEGDADGDSSKSKHNHQLNYKMLVAEVQCSSLLDKVAAENGVQVMRTPTGHPYIQKAMREQHAVLGGELSGHIFFADRYLGFDDALYAALRFLEIWVAKGRDIQKVFADLPQQFTSPQLQIKVASRAEADEVLARLQRTSEEQGLEVDLLDGVKTLFPDKGWALLRASNTQPILWLRCYGETQQALDEIQQFVAQNISL